MAIKSALTQSTQHRMALTPAMRESILLLNLSTSELIHHIEQEALNNPALIIEHPTFPKSSDTTEYGFALDTTPNLETFGEHLRNQLGMMPLDDTIRNIAQYLTGDLTDRGFLPSSAAEIAKTLQQPINQIEQAILALQSCEPTGVGAKDLTECLVLQLIEKGIPPTESMQIISNADLFAKHDWRGLKKILSVPVTSLQRFGEILKGLNPNPAHEFSPEATALFADIVVTKSHTNNLEVSLVNGNIPSLSVADTFKQTANRDPEINDFLEKHQKRALDFVKSVEFRSKTILRVAQSIVYAQHRFFTDDLHPLMPLTRATIAKQLELHPSTVGRAIANKNLSFNGTIYPIRFFFSSAIKNSKSTAISAHSIKTKIRRLILAETDQSTLTDENIVAIFRTEGVDIARRTIAKYRGCMNIPSSPKRRRILVAKAAATNGLGGAQNTRK